MKLQLTRAARALSLAVAALASLHAHAEGVLIGDTFISNGNPALNSGNLPNLNVAFNSPALLAFDPQLPAGTTASQVIKATLWVFVNRVGVPGQLEVLPVTSAWSEGTVTWTNGPAMSSLGSGTAFQVSTAMQTIAIDVTSVVKGWATNPGSNYGFALATALGSPNTVAYFDSKENTGTGHVARLDITLASPPSAANGTFVVGAYGPETCTRSVTPTLGSCPAGYTAIGIGSIRFNSAVGCQSDNGGDTSLIQLAPLCAKN